MNTFSLEEKSVIITGGLGGYGLAICELILKRKGRVLLTDLKSDSQAEEILSNRFKDAFEAKCVLYTKCDVTSEADIEAAFKTAQQKLGSYYGCCNLDIPIYVAIISFFVKTLLL